MIEKTKDVNVPFLGRVGVIEKGTSTEKIRREVMDGREMKILPASVWESFPWPEMRLLLHETGTYVVPTEELVDYLDKLIGEESAIEICAGNGFIGRELGFLLRTAISNRMISKLPFIISWQGNLLSSIRRMSLRWKRTRLLTDSGHIRYLLAMLLINGDMIR